MRRRSWIAHCSALNPTQLAGLDIPLVMRVLRSAIAEFGLIHQLSTVVQQPISGTNVVGQATLRSGVHGSELSSDVTVLVIERLQLFERGHGLLANCQQSAHRRT